MWEAEIIRPLSTCSAPIVEPDGFRDIIRIVPAAPARWCDLTRDEPAGDSPFAILHPERELATMFSRHDRTSDRPAAKTAGAVDDAQRNLPPTVPKPPLDVIR